LSRPRRPSVKVEERNRGVLQKIQALKSEHPFWGYRRVWAYLRYVEEIQINRKRIQRLMQLHGLVVTKDTRLKAKRSSGRPKPRPSAPNQYWGIDMSKVMVNDFGWGYVVIVLDWYTKKIVGSYAGSRSKSEHWLLALDRAVNVQFPDGVRDKGLSLVSDNGCQPTSEAFMRACGSRGIQQIFTSYNNPKGNADTERMFRTMKEELLWLREWSSPRELQQSLEDWIELYNAQYLHSALGYKSPLRYEEEYYASQTLLRVA